MAIQNEQFEIVPARPSIDKGDEVLFVGPIDHELAEYLSFGKPYEVTATGADGFAIVDNDGDNLWITEHDFRLFKKAAPTAPPRPPERKLVSAEELFDEIAPGDILIGRESASEKYAYTVAGVPVVVKGVTKRRGQNAIRVVPVHPIAHKNDPSQPIITSATSFTVFAEDFDVFERYPKDTAPEVGDVVKVVHKPDYYIPFEVGTLAEVVAVTKHLRTVTVLNQKTGHPVVMRLEDVVTSTDQTETKSDENAEGVVILDADSGRVTVEPVPPQQSKEQAAREFVSELSVPDLLRFLASILDGAAK